MTASRFQSTVWCVLAIASCGELPGTDDPRMTDEFVEPGSCSGSVASCDQRTIAQCTNGCAVVAGCYSPVRDRCAGYTTTQACNADTACRLSLDRCVPEDSCYIWDTQSDCIDLASDSCIWGNVCHGQTTVYCYELDDRATCTSTIGCTWTID